MFLCVGSGREGMSYMQAAKWQTFVIATAEENIGKAYERKTSTQRLSCQPACITARVSNLECMV